MACWMDFGDQPILYKSKKRVRSHIFYIVCDGSAAAFCDEIYAAMHLPDSNEPRMAPGQPTNARPCGYVWMNIVWMSQNIQIL